MTLLKINGDQDLVLVVKLLILEDLKILKKQSEHVKKPKKNILESILTIIVYKH